MVKISAFQGIIPAIQFISQVPTQPYSNYSITQIESEIKNNPYSFLNIISNKKSSNRKEHLLKIRKKINDFKEKKILIKNKKESLYIYRQTNENHSYTGLICSISLKDYADKKIKAHEKTIRNRELLFSEYLKTTKIYAEPVLITAKTNLAKLYEKHIQKKEFGNYDFYTKDEIRHQIWEIKEKDEIKDIITFFQQIENLYIADGHHRLASSLRNNKNAMCLAYIVSRNELQTFPFHRKITNIKKPNDLIKRINSLFNMNIIKSPKNNSGKIQFYMNHKWYEIEFNKDQETQLVESLLVSKLLKNILTPIFNIKDERRNKNVHFIPGNQNIKSTIKNLKNNDCLFFMNRINMNNILAIADKNKTTPPKSTFILPKLPSGLIMMELI
tara:strand:+ start:6306 stop:7463 length:1158 start_codon:yes stop_codon:yes gene_type:complete